MGRDVAGLRFDLKPSVVNLKSNGSNQDVAHVSPRALPENVEMDNEPDDHNHDSRDVESTVHEPEEKISQAEADDSTARCSPQSTDEHNSKTTNNLRPHSSSMSRKTQHCRDKETSDEDDNCSVASSISSMRTNKFRVTVPVAPKFTIEERLERRKEYYAKLEEKHKAVAKEKLEQEARIKEEEEAAIKQLRKSMVVKANPIPNFYREGPPPKPELKKPPVTRPKSPKLTRRRSCGDARKYSSFDVGPHERETRRSVGIYREGKNSVNTGKGKNLTATRKSKENTQVEDHPEEQEDAANDVES